MTAQVRDRTSTSPLPTVDRVEPRSTSSWWAPLAAASVIAAVAHVPVTGEHLHEALYIGVLFIVLEVAAVALAVALVIRPTGLVYALVATVGGAAVAALVLSRTIGLPLIGDDIGNWTEPLAVVSLVSEAIMFVGGIVAAGRTTGRTHRLRPTVLAGVLVLVIGLVATWFAAGAEAAGASDDMPGMSGTDMPGMHMGLPVHALPADVG